MIFTGLFLACNLPYFLNKLLDPVSSMLSENNAYPGPLFSNTFMFWYSWPISKIVCTVLNAALNPVLYYYRISGLKEWLTHRAVPGGWSQTVSFQLSEKARKLSSRARNIIVHIPQLLYITHVIHDNHYHV